MNNIPKEPKNMYSNTAIYVFNAKSNGKLTSSGYMMVCSIITGAVKITVNGQTKALFSGDTLILNPYEEAYVEVLGDSPYYSFKLDQTKHFDELCIPALTHFENFVCGDRDVVNICKKISEEYKNHYTFYENMLVALTNQLLIYLYRNYSTAKPIIPSSYLLGKHKIARLAVDYIYRNCQNGITTSEISKHINVSTSYLCRCFKEATGISVLEYAERIRCRKAKEDLSLGVYSVTQIAEKYQFNSLSYFNRRYKKYCGVNPAATLAEAKKRGHLTNK